MNAALKINPLAAAGIQREIVTLAVPEVRTLVVDEPVEEMNTMFNVNGAMIYVNHFVR